MNKFKRYEVVRVDSPVFLISSTHCACHYETGDGKPLAPGYYLSMWPARACRAYYGPLVRYFGPFATAGHASLLQTSALALALVSPEPEPVVPDRASRAACGYRPTRQPGGGLLLAMD